MKSIGVWYHGCIYKAFHQYQYKRDGEKEVFQKLIEEMNNSMLSSNSFYPYDYKSHSGPNVPPITNIQSLEQIQTLEGRAQFIEDFALASWGYDPTYYILNNYKPAMRNIAESGVKTNVRLI